MTNAPVMPQDEQIEEITPDYGPNNEKLPDELQAVLLTLVEHHGKRELLPRREEVIDARRQRFYWRGVQYIYWNQNAGCFSAAGVASQGSGNSVEMPRYTDVYNLYQPYGRSIIAVLTQNPPGVVFEPIDSLNSADIASAATAEKYRHVIDLVNDRKAMQAEIARLFWTDGRVVTYSRHVKDGKKYGYDQDEAEIITAYGVLESKLPITAKSRAECDYIILSKEISINQAKQDYPDAAKKIKGDGVGAGDSTYERNARLGTLQGGRSIAQRGDSYEHLATKTCTWLRPAAFEEAADEFKAQLKELFPNGCYVCFVGKTYVESRDESMDDHISIGHALPGDGMSRPSLGKSLVPIQDTFNDLANQCKETCDFTIPQKYIDSQLMDVAAMQEQVSQPGGAIPVTLPAGADIRARIFEEAPLNIPATLLEFLNLVKADLAEFVTGALPAMFGGSDDHNETASGISQLRDQAMGQMGLPWGAEQELYAGTYKQAILCAANSRDENQSLTVAIPGAKGKVTNEQANIGDLKNGNFRCKADTDANFPETLGAKRAVFQGLLAQAANSPELTQMLMLPDNLALAKRLMGIEEFVSPGAEAADKQLQEIEQLLKQSPVPPTPEALEQFQVISKVAQAIGQPPPPPPQPETSIQVDPQFDYHNFEYDEVQRWLSSPEGIKAKQENPPGVQNVRLHGLQHFQFMQAAMAAQQPPPQAPSPQVHIH